MANHTDLPVLEKHGRPTMTLDGAVGGKKGLEFSPEISHRDLELGSPTTPMTQPTMSLPSPAGNQSEEAARLVSATPYARAEHLPSELKGEFPTKLARIRHWGREYFAEFLVSTVSPLLSWLACNDRH